MRITPNMNLCGPHYLNIHTNYYIRCSYKYNALVVLPVDGENAGKYSLAWWCFRRKQRHHHQKPLTLTHFQLYNYTTPSKTEGYYTWYYTIWYIPKLYKHIHSYHPSPVTGHPSPVTHHPSTITCHPSPVTRHPSPVTRHPSPITNHPSPITHHPSPITNHPSPVTRHRSPITRHPQSAIRAMQSVQIPLVGRLGKIPYPDSWRMGYLKNTKKPSKAHLLSRAFDLFVGLQVSLRSILHSFWPYMQSPSVTITCVSGGHGRIAYKFRAIVCHRTLLFLLLLNWSNQQDVKTLPYIQNLCIIC